MVKDGVGDLPSWEARNRAIARTYHIYSSRIVVITVVVGNDLAIAADLLDSSSQLFVFSWLLVVVLDSLKVCRRLR